MVTDAVGLILDGDTDGAPIRLDLIVLQHADAWTGDTVAVVVDDAGVVQSVEKIGGGDE